jgi:hypothetical protein
VAETLALAVLLAFAVYRVARLIAVDDITEEFRVRLGRWAYDPDEVTIVNDEAVEGAWRSRGRRYLHNLLTCPFCLGVWFAMLAVGIMFAWPWDNNTDLGEWLILVGAVAGMQSTIVLIAEK